MVIIYAYSRMPPESKKPLKTLFCECIKSVRKSKSNEGVAIAICTKSVLHSRGKTFKKFKCKGRKPFLTLRNSK